MFKITTQISIVIALGFIALAAGFFCHLALTDIYHGEADTSLEWKIVQVAALIILFFIASAIFTLSRTLRLIKK